MEHPKTDTTVVMGSRKDSGAAPAATAPDGPGHGALLVLALIFLAAHLVMSGIFVFDGSPGTDAALTGFPLDDSWIHMVYSRSLFEEGLPGYNEGEPENGFTSPLWMVLGAVAHLADSLFGISVVTGVKLIGMLLGWLGSCAMMFLVLGAFREGGDKIALVSAACGGLAVALTPPLVFAEVSGMEISLTVFLMVSAFAAYANRAFLTAGFCAGLALLARPEAVLLVIFLPVLFIAGRLIHRKRTGRASTEGYTAQLVRLGAPGTIFAGLWVIYSLLVTGRALPNTFFAKIETSWLVGGREGSSIADMIGSLFDFGTTVRVVAEAASYATAPVIITLILLCITAVYRIATLRKGRLLAGGVVLFGLLFAHAICVSREMPEGSTHYYYWWRYLVPVIPFFWFIIIAGLDGLLAFGGEVVMRTAARAAGALLFGVVMVSILANTGAVAETFAWNCQNINEVQVAMGEWVAEKVPPGATVAVNDAGAVRYFGGRRTLDLQGLNRHEGIGEMRKGEAFFMLDLPHKVRWLYEHRIDYLVVFPSWYRDIAVASLRGVTVPAAEPGLRLQARFAKVHELTSPHFTITEAPPPGVIGQNVKHVYQPVYQVLE